MALILKQESENYPFTIPFPVCRAGALKREEAPKATFIEHTVLVDKLVGFSHALKQAHFSLPVLLSIVFARLIAAYADQKNMSVVLGVPLKNDVSEKYRCFFNGVAPSWASLITALKGGFPDVKNFLMDDVQECFLLAVPVEKVTATNELTHSNAAVSLSATLDEKDLSLSFKVLDIYFDAQALSCFSQRFVGLMMRIVDDPGQPIMSYPCLTKAEYHEPVYDLLSDALFKVGAKSIVQLFEDQVVSNPDHVAIICKQGEYTYDMLNKKVNQLARYVRATYERLHQGQALQADTMLPISVSRGIDYIISILAVLKAGAAFVPINPDYPVSRIQFILNDIGASFILVEDEAEHTFKEIAPALPRLLLSELAHKELASDNLPLSYNASDLAYVIYTSGSTGSPKGVQAEHINVISQVVNANYFHADSTDTMTFFSDVSFDSTTFEIWGALLNGARLYIPDDVLDLLSQPAQFKEKIQAHNITIMLLTRALFDVLFTLDSTAFSKLNCLLVGGEALTKDIMLSLLHSPDKPMCLQNAYGPTENSTFCTTYEITQDFSQFTSVPIGRPYSNRVTYVLDKYLQLMPVGVVGEAFVGGTSLTRGYLNRRLLNEERFVPNPHARVNNMGMDGRIYKTSDLVRWLPDLNLEYAGRNDFQVKLRGYRIELPEIESHLLAFPGVDHAVVILQDSEAQPYLAGYYVSKSAFPAEEIKQHLGQFLPDYMVPTALIWLRELPVTKNGKLDRKALPLPQRESAPRTAEHAGSMLGVVSDIWQDVLGLQQCDMSTSFFDLGGTSITAMLVRKKLEQQCNISFSIVELFRYTNIRSLAARLSDLVETRSPVDEVVEIRHANQKITRQDDDIAIVGFSCRLPGVDSIDSLWSLLMEGKSNISNFSDEALRRFGVSDTLSASSTYVKRGAVFENPYLFDANFFAYSAKEAKLIDPQQRLFLETAWHALEHSGNVPQKFSGDIGVFVSQGRSTYYTERVRPSAGDTLHSEHQMFQEVLGNEKDFLSTRLSYKLNLRGPSVTLQTACSSSLVSALMACDSLSLGHCDMALAGGVSLFYNHGYRYETGMIASADGYCRAFDADAGGTVITSGSGIVVLKRLQDALQDNDTVYAVIKGGAVNNDGANKVGFTAPSVDGQERVIRKALERAGVLASSVGYVEAHGTGTKLGDPIEWAALESVYGRASGDECLVGALKTNVGHTDSAAGVLGLIKASLVLKERCVPATLNFKRNNVDMTRSDRLKVKNTNTAWDRVGRCAAVSSFGLGGTNAHAIVREAEPVLHSETRASSLSHSSYIVPFSAKTRTALNAMAEKIHQTLLSATQDQMLDIAYTAQVGRADFSERAYCLLSPGEEGAQGVAQPLFSQSDTLGHPEIVMTFTQAISAVSVAEYRRLYESYPKFKAALDSCDIVLGAEALLHKALYANQIVLTPVLTFSLQYALAKFYSACGLVPSVLVFSGVFSAVVSVLVGVYTVSEMLLFLSTGEAFRKPAVLEKAVPVKLYSLKQGAYVDASDLSQKGFWQDHIVFSSMATDFVRDLNTSSLLLCANFEVLAVKNITAGSVVLPRQASFLSVLGQCWQYGVSVMWEALYGKGCRVRKIPLPTYIFDHEHYEVSAELVELADGGQDSKQSLDALLKAGWVAALGVEAADITGSADFLALGGDSLAYLDLFAVLESHFDDALALDMLLEHHDFSSMLAMLEVLSQEMCQSPSW